MSADNNGSLASQMGLIYFKPAGAIMTAADFNAKIMSCPVMVEVEHIFEPEFHENVQIPQLKTTTLFRLAVNFNMANGDGLLSDNDEAEVGLFKEDRTELRSFKMFVQEDKPKAVENEDDKAVMNVVSFTTTSKVLKQAASIDDMHKSVFLKQLGLTDPNDPEYYLRSRKWFEQLSGHLGRYARATKFIADSGSRVITDPTTSAANPPLSVKPAANPLAINMDEDDTQTGATLLPAITTEQLEAKRQERQDAMEAIRTSFVNANRILYRVPVPQVNDNTHLRVVLEDLLDGVPIDSFLADRVVEVIESAVIRIG